MRAYPDYRIRNRFRRSVAESSGGPAHGFHDADAERAAVFAGAARNAFGRVVRQSPVVFAHRLGNRAVVGAEVAELFDRGDVDSGRAGSTMAAVHAMTVPGKFIQTRKS